MPCDWSAAASEKPAKRRKTTGSANPVTAVPKFETTPKTTSKTGMASDVSESGIAPVSHRTAAKSVTPSA
jgi:hypothetical protein